MSMDKPKIGRFESVSLDYANRSEYHDSHDLINELWPLYRQAEALPRRTSVLLFFNIEEGFVCVNGETIPFSPMALGPGEWWCYILKKEEDGLSTVAVSYQPGTEPSYFEACIIKKEDRKALEKDVRFAFKVIDVFDDYSFQQYAYGEVVISGLLLDESRIAPFHLNVINYRDDRKKEIHYYVYLPQTPDNPCLWYNGWKLPIKDVVNDFHEIFVDDEGNASVIGVIRKRRAAPDADGREYPHDDSNVVIPPYYLEIAQEVPIVNDDDSSSEYDSDSSSEEEDEIVETFPIVAISPKVDKMPGPQDVEPDDSSEESDSSADESSEEPILTREVEFPQLGKDEHKRAMQPILRLGSEEVKYRTLLRPFCITAFDKPEDYEYTNRCMMFIPKYSIVINNQPVNIKTPADSTEKIGDLLPVTQGEWWCIIRERDEEEDSEESEDEYYEDEFSRNFEAELLVSEGYPHKKNIFFAFKVAEIYSEEFGEGAFQEFAYGEVTICRPHRGIERLVPFETIAVTLTDANFRQQRNYFTYTPAGKSIIYNGQSIPIDGAEGNWTRLPIPTGGMSVPRKSFWCYLKNGESAAHITDSKPAFDSGDIKFYFPVVGIGQEIDDPESFDSARIVLVGAEESEVSSGLPGAVLDVENMSEMFEHYATEIRILRNEDATVKGVKNALKWAVDGTEGVAVFYVSSHGNCEQGHNTVSLYDGRLTDDEVWEIIKDSHKPVWLIFDTCMSGTMYGPPDAEKYAHSWGTYFRSMATRSASDLQMMCWSGANDSAVGWGSATEGGHFTNAIIRHVKRGRSYFDIWGLVIHDDALTTAPFEQIPVASEIGDFWSRLKFFLIEP